MAKRGKKIEPKILEINPVFEPLFRDDLDTTMRLEEEGRVNHLWQR